MPGRSLVLIVVLVAASVRTARPEPPRIDDIRPAGLTRGVVTEVVVRGEGLGAHPRLVAGMPVAAEGEGTAAPDGKSWTVRLNVPATAPLGVGLLRVQTDEGLSNPFPLEVGPWRATPEAEPNDAPGAAQRIELPTVVDGEAAGNDVDHFRFAGRKGQKLVVDARCLRIGSGLDPQVRLSTAGMRFVGSADDSTGLLTDALLIVELPEDGEYILELSDTKYQGTGRPVYRLVVGEIPVATELYPLGGRRGETVGFELSGGTLTSPAIAAERMSVPAGVDERRLFVPTATLGMATPAEIEVLPGAAVGDLPELRESAQAGDPPLHVVPPAVVNGRIDPAGDEDRVVLEGLTPGKVRVRVEAAALGSALDGVLQVLKTGGGELAKADDTTLKLPLAGDATKTADVVVPDPSLEFDVPGGTTSVELALRDLDGRGGAGYAYRLVVEPVRPAFSLRLQSSQVSLPRGGTTAVAVAVDRLGGYGGPIQLAVRELPDGWTAKGGTVAPGQASGVLSISASADAQSGPVELEVVGTAPEGAPPASATASFVLAQQNNLPMRIIHLPRLAGALAPGVPVALEVPAEPAVIAHGVGGKVPIKVVKTNGDVGELSVSALSPPAGLNVPEVKVPADKGEADARIDAALEAVVGKMSVVLVAKGKVGGKDRTFVSPAFDVEVVRPAALEGTPESIEVKAGAAVEVKGKVVRKGEFGGPVTVRLDGLPAGVSAEPATVAPEASEFTLKVTAAESAAAAEATAQAVLAFKVGDKDYPPADTALKVKVVKP